MSVPPRHPGPDLDGYLTVRSSTVVARMDFHDSAEDATFRSEVRDWLVEHLTGEFATVGSRGGPADETGWDIRLEWERLLGRDGWVGLSWADAARGGRGGGLDSGRHAE